MVQQRCVYEIPSSLVSETHTGGGVQRSMLLVQPGCIAEVRHWGQWECVCEDA